MNLPPVPVAAPAPNPLPRPSVIARLNPLDGHWRAIGSIATNLGLTAIILVVAIGLIGGNYHIVGQTQQMPQRMRWYLVPRSDMVANQALRDEDFEPHIGWLPAGESDILPAGTSIAKEYLAHDVAKGLWLHRADIVPSPICPSDSAEKIVPVKMRADVATMLKPKMVVGLLPADTTTSSIGPCALGPYTVVAVVPPAGDTATVLLAIGTDENKSLPDGLTSRLWIPVLLPANPETQNNAVQ